MQYFKTIVEGFIISIGTGPNGNITEAEYNQILSAIHDKPARTETTDYKLREDLTWEAYEVEPTPAPEPTDADKAEAYDILMGGAT